MAEYKWPEADKRTLIGKRISRVDGPQKVSGRAKYSYDINRPGMLFGKIVRCPHAHARVTSIDTSAAGAHNARAEHQRNRQRDARHLQEISPRDAVLLAGLVIIITHRCLPDRAARDSLVRRGSFTKFHFIATTRAEAGSISPYVAEFAKIVEVVELAFAE